VSKAVPKALPKADVPIQPEPVQPEPIQPESDVLRSILETKSKEYEETPENVETQVPLGVRRSLTNIPKVAEMVEPLNKKTKKLGMNAFLAEKELLEYSRQ
jgi:hypothetical protein